MKKTVLICSIALGLVLAIGLAVNFQSLNSAGDRGVVDSASAEEVLGESRNIAEEADLAADSSDTTANFDYTEELITDLYEYTEDDAYDASVADISENTADANAKRGAKGADTKRVVKGGKDNGEGISERIVSIVETPPDYIVQEEVSAAENSDDGTGDDCVEDFGDGTDDEDADVIEIGKPSWPINSSYHIKYIDYLSKSVIHEETVEVTVRTGLKLYQPEGYIFVDETGKKISHDYARQNLLTSGKDEVKVFLKKVESEDTVHIDGGSVSISYIDFDTDEVLKSDGHPVGTSLIYVMKDIEGFHFVDCSGKEIDSEAAKMLYVSPNMFGGNSIGVYVRSNDYTESEQEVNPQDPHNPFHPYNPRPSYVKDQVFGLIDTEEEAEEIASRYDIILLAYSYGVATYNTNGKTIDEVIRMAAADGYQLCYNHIYYLDDPVDYPIFYIEGSMDKDNDADMNLEDEAESENEMESDVGDETDTENESEAEAESVTDAVNESEAGNGAETDVVIKDEAGNVG